MNDSEETTLRQAMEYDPESVIDLIRDNWGSVKYSFFKKYYHLYKLSDE